MADQSVTIRVGECDVCHDAALIFPIASPLGVGTRVYCSVCIAEHAEPLGDLEAVYLDCSGNVEDWVLDTLTWRDSHYLTFRASITKGE